MRIDILEILINHEIAIIDTLISWIDLIVEIKKCDYVNIIKDYASKKCFYMSLFPLRWGKEANEDEKEMMIVVLNNFIFVKNLIDEFISKQSLIRKNLSCCSFLSKISQKYVNVLPITINCTEKILVTLLRGATERYLQIEEYCIRLHTKWKYYLVI